MVKTKAKASWWMALVLVMALLLAGCADAGDNNDALATTEPGVVEPGVDEPGVDEPSVTDPEGDEPTLANGALVIKSSDLAGLDVYGADNDDLGEVSHALVDAQGKIQYVVFDVGGFLGVGERVVAVPWGSFQIVPDDTRPHLVYSGTQADLEAMPEMDDVDLGGGHIDANGTDYHGLVALGQTITDFNVVDAHGEDLGEVEDVLFDMKAGQVQYGIVDFGGFLGLAENTVAVPWQRMQLLAGEDGEPNDTVFQLDVTEDTLRNAPVFDGDDLRTWPDPVDPNWDADIRGFWDAVV